MALSPLNKTSSTPLYLQLKEYILNLIESERLAPNEQLSSERELSDEYGISRQTVRQAINELVLRGVLNRSQGKGTYVAPRKVRQDLLHVTSFTNLILDWGMTTSVRAIASQIISAPPFVERLLELSPGTPVFQFERVRLVDGEPVAVHRSYVPKDIAQPLLSIALDSQSLMGLLATECGVRVVSSQETMEPTVADKFEAELLEVSVGAPLQLIVGRLLSESGRPTECHKSLYRGDRFQFAFEGVLDSSRPLTQTGSRGRG